MAELLVVDDVLDDLRRFQRSGEFPRILKKLLQIAADPINCGQPLGRELSTFRKLTFGNRNWRIIFRPDVDGSSVTVWVIGDREDMECYEMAKKRIEALGDSPVRQTLSDAAATFDESLSRVSDAIQDGS